MKITFGLGTGPLLPYCLSCGCVISGKRATTMLFECTSGSEPEPLRSVGYLCGKCSSDLVEECGEYPGLDVRYAHAREALSRVASSLRALADELEVAEVAEAEELADSKR